MNFYTYQLLMLEYLARFESTESGAVVQLINKSLLGGLWHWFIQWSVKSRLSMKHVDFSNSQLAKPLI